MFCNIKDLLCVFATVIDASFFSATNSNIVEKVFEQWKSREFTISFISAFHVFIWLHFWNFTCPKQKFTQCSSNFALQCYRFTLHKLSQLNLHSKLTEFPSLTFAMRSLTGCKAFKYYEINLCYMICNRKLFAWKCLAYFRLYTHFIHRVTEHKTKPKSNSSPMVDTFQSSWQFECLWCLLSAFIYVWICPISSHFSYSSNSSSLSLLTMNEWQPENDSVLGE